MTLVMPSKEALLHASTAPLPRPGRWHRVAEALTFLGGRAATPPQPSEPRFPEQVPRKPSMRITEVREITKPISSPIRNAYIDFSKMTLSLVAVITDVIRD